MTVEDAQLYREFGQRLEAMDRRIEQRFDLEDRARTAALAAMDERLGLLNELRTGVMTREEYEAKHEALVDRVHKVEQLAWKAAGAGGAIGAALSALLLRLMGG